MPSCGKFTTMKFHIVRLLSIVLAGVITCGASCKNSVSSNDNNPKPISGDITVMFYNVENLFDVTDDPNVMDEDFTPEGKLKWTQERYETKLSRLADVIDTIPGVLPALVGMCEVENKMVLEDLVKEGKLKGAGYNILHKDSPDERGIDVALLYNPSMVKINSYNYISVVLPDPNDSRTRDILFVDASINKEKFYLFVNHWPSRSGGQAESEPNRLAVAGVLKEEIKKVEAADKDAKILIMGDFNDYPDNKSIAEVIGAGDEKSAYFNFMRDDQVRKEGSYFYKGEWTVLDQFISSKALINSPKGLSVQYDSAVIYKSEMICFKDKEGNLRPNRTYVGEDYKAGYSDHLPIYIKLAIKK